MILETIVSLLRGIDARLARLEQKVEALTINCQCREHDAKYNAIIHKQVTR